MKVRLGKGMFWSKLGSGFEKLVCISPRRIPTWTNTPVVEDYKPINFLKLSSHESKIQTYRWFRWLYRDRKVFPDPCEDRTHDLGVISTTLYRLS